MVVVVVREEEGGFGSLGDKVGVGEVRQGKKARQLKLVGRVKDSGRKCPGRGKDWGG